MTIEENTGVAASVPAEAEQDTAHHRLRLRHLDRYVIVLIWAFIIALFGALRPNIFLTSLTVKTLLSDQAITCALAVGVTLTLAAGVIDLSFAAIAGFAMVLATKLSASPNWNLWLIILITVLGCVAMSTVSSLLITWLKVNSLIVTLGIMSVAIGFTEDITSGNTLTGQFSTSFTNIGQGYWGMIPIPFALAIALAVIVYYLLEHTPLGRRTLAIGSNMTAARLTGVRVARLQIGAILAGGVIAALTGVILAVKTGQATDTIGAGYLLPVIASVFLGSTQFKDRVNVVGSIVAALTLGTGIKGLELMGASPWVSDFFNGAVLLAAVAFVAIRARRQD
jgi:ribose transport system permease protein